MYVGEFVFEANNADLIVTIRNGDNHLYLGYAAQYQQYFQHPFRLRHTVVSVGDFNGDHRLDVVISSFYTSIIGVFLDFGNARFASQITFPAGSPPSVITLGDFNDDGRPDLAMLLNGSADVGIFLNTC